MPVLGEIDLTKAPQKPNLFLARPNGTVIAKLTDAFEVSLEVKLGSINKLEFKLPFELEYDHELVRNEHIDQLRERYLIKLVLGDAEEWYVISELNDSGDDSGDTKHIVANLIADELQSKLFRKYTTEGEDGVGPQNLTQITTTALSGTLWSIGYVDGSFDTMYRSFNITSQNALSFLFQIAETFKAVIMWDSINRKVSFYKQENVGLNRGFTISYGKYLKTLRKNIKVDEMVTRLKVFGKDDLSIQRVNPTGSNYLEDFSFFLFPFQRDAAKNVLVSSNYMSDALCNALMDYQNLVASQQGVFTGLLAQKNTLRTQESDARSLLTDYQLDLQLTEDNVDVQKNLAAYQRNDSPGASEVMTLKGGYKHAVIVRITDTAGATFKVDGVTKSIPSNTWTVVAKKDLMGKDALGKYQNGSVTLTVSGLAAGAGVTYITCKITDGEFIGGATDGVSITSDGAAKSVLTSTDLELEWGLLNVGDTVYIENGKLVGYQFSGADSDLAGIITSINLTGKAPKITLDRQFPEGTYSKGWLIATANNDGVIVARYVVDYRQAKVASQLTAVNKVTADITALDIQINDLRITLDMETNFTSDEIRELNPFIIEKEWSDSNYISDQDLYDDAVKKFELMKQPQTVIEIDIVNFLEVLEAQSDWDKLNLGDTIAIKYEKFNVNVKAKIIEIRYNFESDDINLTIANVTDIESDKDKLVKMLYKSVSSSAAVDMNKFKWDTTAGSVNEINSIINGVWNAAKRGITAGTKQSVTIDDRGITITDPTEPLAYLRVTHGVLGITNDGGNTYKQAITKDGVVAERLYGQIIMGENLIVGDADGILKLLGNKGIVYDRIGTEVMKFGLYDATPGAERFGLELKNSNHKVIVDRDSGFKIQKKDSTAPGGYADLAWLDVNGKLNLKDIVASGTIEATTLIATTQLKVGNINVADLIANGLQTTSNWIKASQIDADAITAKHTITGATIQTATTGARVVINSTGLSAYNATTEIFSIKNGSINMTSGSITWGAGGVNAPTPTNVGAEAAIIKSNTAPATPAVGQLWLDTTAVPNALKRWDGTAWTKASATTAADIGAKPSSYVPSSTEIRNVYAPTETEINNAIGTSRLTKISPTGIYSGTVQTNQLIVGGALIGNALINDLSASKINAGTLNAAYISTEIAQVNATISIGSSETRGRVNLHTPATGRPTYVEASTDPYGAAQMNLVSDVVYMKSIAAGGSVSVQFGTGSTIEFGNATVNFAGATVNGLNLTAKFG